MVIKLPKNIRSDYKGYEFLINLYNKTKDLEFTNIFIDFDKTIWFDANLSAVLGAIITNVENNINPITLRNISDGLTKTLEKNNFLSHFGGKSILDIYGTSIKYRKFKTTEDKLFKSYINDKLLYRKAFPTMSSLLKKKINQSIFEIFNNAIIHGECQHIFCCGQSFPKAERLDFTIVDMGKTIKNNVSEYLNTEISGKEAIEWAVSEGNTTKNGNIPGGLGLKLIKEFISYNNGKIQIISSDGFWEQDKNNTFAESFKNEFQGTIVNLEININDNASYYLNSELSENDIF